MKRVLSCRCDVCRTRNTVVKGAVYVISFVFVLKAIKYFLAILCSQISDEISSDNRFLYSITRYFSMIFSPRDLASAVETNFPC